MSETDTYILFELADSTYAIRSEDVQHVEMLEHVTPVPNTAPAVDGVVFSRGQVLPAINLRARFGLPRQEYTKQSRLIFLKVQQRVVALIVDAARDFRRIPAEATSAIEAALHGIDGDYVKGVAKVKNQMVLLLDVAAVLNLAEITLPAGAPTSPPENAPAAPSLP